MKSRAKPDNSQRTADPDIFPRRLSGNGKALAAKTADDSCFRRVSNSASVVTVTMDRGACSPLTDLNVLRHWTSREGLEPKWPDNVGDEFIREALKELQTSWTTRELSETPVFTETHRLCR